MKFFSFFFFYFIHCMIFVFVVLYCVVNIKLFVDDHTLFTSISYSVCRRKQANKMWFHFYRVLFFFSLDNNNLARSKLYVSLLCSHEIKVLFIMILLVTIVNLSVDCKIKMLTWHVHYSWYMYEIWNRWV